MSINNIKDCKTFEEVRQVRLDLDTQIRRNGDEYDRILTDIYKKPTHFIYELMQNANDAKATKARFVLSEDKIEFYHNGSKDFDLESIIGITNVGNSSKKDDSETIGKFGVGFKSVFKITKSPKIYNRLCSFKIERLRVPTKIQPKRLPDEYTTEFELVFDAREGLTKKEIFKQIKKELTELDARSIMFLQNLKTVEIKGEVKSSIELEEKKTRYGFSINTNLATDEQHILFRGGTKNGVVIAYGLCDDYIVQCDDTEISVYFPTQVESGLSFLVNAPFDTPVTRESINFETKYNQKILKEVGDVFEKSIFALRDAGYYDSSFIEEILLIGSSFWHNEEVYCYLKERLVKLFRKSALIPAGEEFRKASNVYLAEDYRIRQLWEYPNKPWADIPDNYDGLRSFLIHDVGVKIIRFQEFANHISKELKKGNPALDTEWLYDFYSYCGQSQRYYELEEIPIIKNRANGYVSAWKNGSQNIFKPPAKGVARTKILNKILSDDALDRLAKTDNNKASNIKALLSQLEIKERSPKSTIEMDIMSEWEKTNSLEGRKKLFFAIVDIYNSATKDEKNAITNYLENKKIFYGGNQKSHGWFTGKELYGRDDYLVNLLSRYNVNFIDRRFWLDKYEETADKNGNTIRKNTGSVEFCEALGVSRCFRTTPYDGECHINYSDIKNRYRADVYENEHGYGFKSDRTIRNIDKIIKTLKTQKDVTDFVHAISGIPETELYAEIGASSGRVLIHSSSPILRIPAHFLRIVNDKEWIIVDGRTISPHEINREDFIMQFGLDGSEPFLNHILFEPDGLQNLSNREREAYDLVRQMDEQDFIRFKKEYEKRKTDEIRETDDTPMIDISSFQKTSLKEHVIDIDEKFDDFPPDDPKGPITTRKRRERTTTKTTITSNYKKQLGDKGEDETLRKLKEQYPQDEGYVIEKYCGNHKAYDFKVSKDDKTIKYIDSKYSENGIIELSPSQVDAAFKYQDKYEIYAYIGNEKKYSIIVNPFEKFVKREIASGITFVVSAK